MPTPDPFSPAYHPDHAKGPAYPAQTPFAPTPDRTARPGAAPRDDVVHREGPKDGR